VQPTCYRLLHGHLGCTARVSHTRLVGDT
jgi:hypothetical protein